MNSEKVFKISFLIFALKNLFKNPEMFWRAIFMFAACQASSWIVLFQKIQMGHRYVENRTYGFVMIMIHDLVIQIWLYWMHNHTVTVHTSTIIYWVSKNKNLTVAYSPRLLILSIKLLWSEVVKNLSAFSFNWFRTFETKFLEHPDMTSSLECRLASNSQQIHHISIFNCPVVTSDRYSSNIGCPQKCSLLRTP